MSRLPSRPIKSVCGDETHTAQVIPVCTKATAGAESSSSQAHLGILVDFKLCFSRSGRGLVGISNKLLGDAGSAGS